MRTLKVLLIALMFLPSMTFAGGGLETIDMSVSKTSAIANGIDSIKVTVRLFRYKCTSNKLADYGGGMATVTTYSLTEAQTMCNTWTGSTSVAGKITVDSALAITDPKLQLSVAGTLKNPDNANYVDTGYAYFTIKSSSAGSKSLIAKSNGSSFAAWSGHDTKSVTFTAPSTTSTDSGSNTTTEAGAEEEAKVEAKNKPAAPVVVALEAGGNRVNYEQDTNGEQNRHQYEYGKELKFSGKTIPGGTVTLHFYSEEFVATTVADTEGNWGYVLTEDIGEGDHELKMTVADPKTKATSDLSEPVEFSLVKVASVNTVAEEKNDMVIWYYIGGGLLLLLVAGVTTFLVLKKKKNTPKTEV